jgi:citrate lyase subunit beta/citryl-CoA lyase
MARLAFGSIDFCADLGIGHTRQALLAARSEIVLASRLAGLFAPIDGVTTAIDNTELIEDDARYARELGFRGKLCIHPRQLMPARRGFSPSADEISWAQRILAAGPHGAISVDGKMVDAPVRAQAQRILAFAAVAV